MAWSARREGMILEVAGVPDDVALYINERADSEGRTVDAVACEMLAVAMSPPKAQVHTMRFRPTLPSRVYGIINRGGHFTVESAEVQNVTEKSVIVKERLPGYGKHIKKLRYNGRPETIGFTPAEAVRRYLDVERDYLAESRKREPYGDFWTAEQIARNVRYHEQCVASLERLLERVSISPATA